MRDYKYKASLWYLAKPCIRKKKVQWKGRGGKVRKGKRRDKHFHRPGIMTGMLYSRFLKLLVMFQWNMIILIASMRKLSLRCMHSPKQERDRAEIISGETHSLASLTIYALILNDFGFMTVCNSGSSCYLSCVDFNNGKDQSADTKLHY